MINQIAVFLENRKGRVGECCKALKEAGINLCSMSIADTRDFGILRLMTDNNDEAVKTLKAAGFMCSTVQLIAIEVPDRPGALADILIALDAAGVNIEYLYSFANAAGKAHIGFKTENKDVACDLLKKMNVKII